MGSEKYFNINFLTPFLFSEFIDNRQSTVFEALSFIYISVFRVFGSN